MTMSTGFKDSEIGRIPVDWSVTTLGELTQVTSSKRVFQKDWRSSGVPFYRARELAVMSEQEQVDSELFIDAKLYDELVGQYGAPIEGDLLVTGRGTLGRTYLVRPGDRFYFQDGNITWVKRSKWLDSRFLEQLYRTPVVRAQVTGESAGTTVGTYTITNARNTKIPLPAISEQRQIADVLCDTDDMARALLRLIAKKDEIKRGMMQELLRGKTRLPGFSTEWRAVRFRDLAFPVKERISPSSTDGPSEVVELEHLESATGRLVGSGLLANSASLKTRFRAGDVLFGKLRAYLRKYWLADRDGYCSTEIWALRAKPGWAVGGYIRYLVESEAFIDAAAISYGTHMPRSDWRIVGGLETRVPMFDEQAAIASILLDADAEIQALRDSLNECKAIKQGMMQELLTGKTRFMPQEVPA